MKNCFLFSLLIMLVACGSGGSESPPSLNDSDDDSSIDRSESDADSSESNVDSLNHGLNGKIY